MPKLSPLCWAMPQGCMPWWTPTGCCSSVPFSASEIGAGVLAIPGGMSSLRHWVPPMEPLHNQQHDWQQPWGPSGHEKQLWCGNGCTSLSSAHSSTGAKRQRDAPAAALGSRRQIRMKEGFWTLSLVLVVAGFFLFCGTDWAGVGESPT